MRFVKVSESGVYKSLCPSCRSKDKIVFKCGLCHQKICIMCSVKGLCKDCFIDTYQDDESEIYQKLKFENPSRFSTS